MKKTLEYNGYLGSISFDSEDMIFFGKIEGINDLVSYEADSISGLQLAFQKAVDDYLDELMLKGEDNTPNEAKNNNSVEGKTS